MSMKRIDLTNQRFGKLICLLGKSDQKTEIVINITCVSVIAVKQKVSLVAI